MKFFEEKKEGTPFPDAPFKFTVNTNYVAPAYRRKWVLRVPIPCGESGGTKIMYFEDRVGTKLAENFSDAYIYNSKQAAETIVKYYGKNIETEQLKADRANGDPIPTPIDITVMLPNIEENADLF